MIHAHLANTPTRLHKLRANPTNALWVRLVQQGKHRQEQQHVPTARRVNIKMTPLKQAARTAERASTATKLHNLPNPRAKFVTPENTKMKMLNQAAKSVEQARTIAKLHKPMLLPVSIAQAANTKTRTHRQTAKVVVLVNTLTKRARQHVPETHVSQVNIFQA